MRITRFMVLQNALRGLVGNLNTLARAHEEVASGRKINRVSDAPVEASVIMQLDSQLRGMERYRRAITSVDTRLATEEAVLDSVQSLLRQARDSVAVTSGENDPLRENAKSQIDEIRKQLISLGNTRVSGEYIFGGGSVGAPPFQQDGTYVGNTNSRVVEIAEGLQVPVNHTGDQILSDTLAALDRLGQELETGDADSVQSALEQLSAAGESLRSVQGELGSTMQQVSEIESYLVRQSNTLQGQKADIRDADPAESAIKLNEASVALERAYAAVAKVLSTNILDFLR